MLEEQSIWSEIIVIRFGINYVMRMEMHYLLQKKELEQILVMKLQLAV